MILKSLTFLLMTHGLLELQFRIYPQKSLLDVNISKIEEKLRSLGSIESVQIFDDRLSDASFITVLVRLSDTSETALEELKQQLLTLKKVKVTIISPTYEKMELESIPAQELLRFGKEK